jgi:hypothetical protein
VPGATSLILRKLMLERLAAGQKILHIFPEEKGDFDLNQRLPIHLRHSEPRICRAYIRQLRRVTLDEIGELEARRAGFRHVEQLHDYWRKTHGTGPLAKPLVWVLELELDLEHEPLLLHRDPAKGYTHDPRFAAQEEGESPSRSDLSLYAEENWRVFRARRDRGEVAREEARSLARRLRHAIVSGDREEIRRIRAELERYDNGGEQAA